MTSPPRIVALGGGHGLAATLAGLRQVSDRLTAVVTVADDGGSSGRLRSGYGLLPPGDLRMALTALAGPCATADRWRQLLQHRFPAVPPGAPDAAVAGLEGHPVGNLLLAGLMQQLDDPVAALDTVGALLGLAADTRVLPMATQPLDIEAEVAGLAPHGELVTVRGQVAVATTRGRVVMLRLLPPQSRACPEALAALRAADLVVLGPGSLFTSVLPHLLLPELREAVTGSRARRVLVLNLAPQPGETDGFAPEAHLEVLAAHAPELRLDVVLADAAATRDDDDLLGGLAAVAEDLGARVQRFPLARRDRPEVHDPVALAAAFGQIVGSATGGGWALG